VVEHRNLLSPGLSLPAGLHRVGTEPHAAVEG